MGRRRAGFAATVGAGDARVWGMTGADRLQRTFERSGLRPARREDLEGLDGGSGVVLVRADWVYDEGLIAAVAARPGALLVAPTGQVLAAHVRAPDAAAAADHLEMGADLAQHFQGLERLDPADLAYNRALRKREPPVLEPLTRANVRSVEARLFKGSYKGVTDLVTKYLWPRPARIVTRWCALAGLSPNQVTFAGLLLVIAAFWLFWNGHFGWGLVCAWLMTFLDTVDGKLARVTLTSSKVGNVFDHGIDLVHPPFWWWAWFVGVQQTAHPAPYPELVLLAVVGGYVAQRLVEAVFLRRFKFHIHAWRPFDSWFRLITARRNPNLILLTATALVGRPDVGLVSVAIWTLASLLVHLVQLGQALGAPRNRVSAWLS